MKKLLLAILFLGGLSLAFIAKDEPVDLEIGAKAPMTDVKMDATNGKKLSLNALSREKGLLVIFTCNTCPFVIAWEDRYNDLHDLALENGIGTVLVNSNEAKRKDGAGDDSMAAMKKHAEELGYKSAYVLDKNSALANAFGARTTPHVYLFDSEMKLVYRGAIDDNHKSKEEASARYLMDALSNLGSGKDIQPKTTKAMGCSIKRV